MAIRIERECLQCGVMFEVRPRSGSYPQKYCGIPCANLSMRKAKPSSRYAKSKVPEGHPLRDPHGQCMTHRVVLWEKIGPGEHSCHYCGTTVDWKPGEYLTATSLVAEHADGNTRNNDPANIVPACQKCNAKKMRRTVRPTIRPDEIHVVYADGTRTRGEVRNCRACNKEFTVRVNAGPGQGVCCSRKCSNFQDAGKRKTCPHCGNGFRTYQDTVHCSPSCRRAARLKAATRNCIHCGTEFCNPRKTVFCGMACLHAAHRGRPRKKRTVTAPAEAHP